jgi:hypothetical protein
MAEKKTKSVKAPKTPKTPKSKKPAAEVSADSENATSKPQKAGDKAPTSRARIASGW